MTHETVQLQLPIGEVTGEGTSGVVAPLLHAIDGGRYVVKRLKEPGQESQANLANEIRLHKLCSADCEAVVRYAFAGSSATGEVLVLMEACDNILWDALTNSPAWNALAQQQPSSADRQAWTLQLCKAVAHCHSLRVLHRDLNPWNVFLVCGSGTQSKSIRLGDFGLAVQLRNDLNELSGIEAGDGAVALDDSSLTSLYSAPELGKRYGFPADVFSLGMTLLALWTSAECSCEEDALIETIECVKLAAKETPNPKVPSLAAASARHRNLIALMVAGDPAARPTAKHAAVDSLDALSLPTAATAKLSNQAKQAFAHFKAQAPGKLTKHELGGILDALGQPKSMQDAIVEAVFLSLGDKDARIDLDEFSQWLFPD